MALPNLPQSRNEKYLAKIAGQEVELPNEPLSREEQYLDYIAKNGGGGGGYVLPTATASRLGGVKIGSGINVEEDGTISADIPTKVSDLDNDVNFISDDDYVHTDHNYDDTAKGIVDGVTEALAGKQDTLTFDNIPTENSTNPVKSGGVYSADEAIRKWTTAEAKSVSGNPITLTDGSARKAEGLAVTCNPKQNLHGYDHPWAGGAGKNKFDINKVTGESVTVSVSDDVMTVTGAASRGRAILLGTDISHDAESTYTLSFTIDSISGYAGQALFFGFAIKKSDTTLRYVNTANCNTTGDKSVSVTLATGEIIYRIDFNVNDSGNDLSDPCTFVLSKVQLEKSSSKTSYAPYSNECPITGYTECVVDDDGKNLLAGVENGAIDTTTGQDTPQQNTYRSIGYIKVSAGSYTVSHFLNNTNNTIRFFKYDTNKNYLGSEAISGNMAITLTVDSSVAFIRFHGNVVSFTDINPPQFEHGTRATEYAPYVAPDTATITFGQTVYGGSVDFKTGKVTVTHAICTENDFGAVGAGTSGGGLNYANILPNAISIKTTTNAISNMLIQNQSGWSSTTPCFTINTGVEPIINPIRVYGTFESLAAFKTAYSGLQIAVELANPVELTLTPAELELLKGYNYITTNGTTIALNYLPDSLLAEAENYVDKKIPPAPSSVTVTADGSKSVAQLLNDLFLLVDMTQITSGSKLIRVTSTSTVVYHIVEYTASSLYYSYDIVTSEHWQIMTFILKDDDSSYHQVYDNTRYDKSSDVPASGTIFAIYY